MKIIVFSSTYRDITLQAKVYLVNDHPDAMKEDLRALAQQMSDEAEEFRLSCERIAESFAMLHGEG